MALADLTDPAAVRAAIADFDDRGRDEFLAHYGFKRARGYFILYGGRRYDSKAILGVAHGYQFGEFLRAADFSGGEKTVAAVAERLGFTMQRPGGLPSQGDGHPPMEPADQA